MYIQILLSCSTLSIQYMTEIYIQEWRICYQMSDVYIIESASQLHRHVVPTCTNAPTIMRPLCRTLMITWNRSISPSNCQVVKSSNWSRDVIIEEVLTSAIAKLLNCLIVDIAWSHHWKSADLSDCQVDKLSNCWHRVTSSLKKCWPQWLSSCQIV